MRNLRFSAFAACAGSLGALVGCGGGAGTSSPSQSVNSLSAGEATINFVGQLKPAVAVSGNGVTVEGMAGANVTQFSLVPTPENKNSLIAYSLGDHLETLYAGRNSVITGITKAVALDPSFTNNGQIVFVGEDGTNNTALSVYTCRYDGSGLTRLFGSANIGSKIAWFPSGTEVAYSNGTNIYTNNLAGTNERELTAGTNPSISPDGTTMAYTNTVAGHAQIFTIPVAGGTPKEISINDSQTSNLDDSTFTPDSKWVFWDADTGTSRNINFQALNNNAPGLFGVITPVGTGEIYNPSFSPDGNYVMYDYTSTYGGSDVALYYQSSLIGPQALLVQGLAEYRLFGSWSPFFQKKTFVGSGGSMFTSAAGFVWTELQGSMESVLAFTATTPSKASVTAETASGAQTQIMHLSADSITGLKYTNSYYANPINIIPGAQSAVSDVLVSYDGTDGAVDTIAPYVETRAATAPAKSVQGGNLVYSGKFLGVWNKGKNLAPNGASQVVLNPKSGKLVSFN